AVTGRRTRRGDADGYQTIALACDLGRREYGAVETRTDLMIGGEEAGNDVAETLVDAQAGECDGGSRVARRRFHQHVLERHVGQLFMHQVEVTLGGGDEDALRRVGKWQNAVIGRLDQRAAPAT